MATLRVLGAGDEAGLETFLARHADSSMFLRANARVAGLEDRGEPFQATYAAAFESGRIVAVAAHCWNGNILLQAPQLTAEVAQAAAARSGRRVAGLLGPWAQVDAARRALGLAGAAAAKTGREALFALDLADLIVPESLARGAVRHRLATAADLDLLIAWRVAFSLEALGLTDGPALHAEARDDLTRSVAHGASWVLEEDGRAVAYSAFNGRLPEIVQIGGVWTPPELRGRGYARAVVAGSLLDARREGVRRAVLFAEDPAAQRAYLALGFRVTGDYGLVLFATAS